MAVTSRDPLARERETGKVISNEQSPRSSRCGGSRRGAARAGRQNRRARWAPEPLRFRRRGDSSRFIGEGLQQSREARQARPRHPHEVFLSSSSPPAVFRCSIAVGVEIQLDCRGGGNSAGLPLIYSLVRKQEKIYIIHQLERMGYGMSRLEDEYYEPEEQNSDGSSSAQVDDEFSKLHNDIFHMTRMRSGLSESIYKSMGTNRGIISTTKLLSGREVDCSGKGMFSSRDRASVLGHCVPMNGPKLLDRMDSRAYVSQFSADGTLFVAGFQGSHIRIYDVDRGWSIHKDIHARSLRWTISDVSLSPDQRHLVYSSLAPIIHIVNVGKAARESYANVTDIHDGLDFSQHEDVQYSFGIFSVKFSSDGRELVAGSNDDSIYVYDLHANKLTLRLPAHTSDVNTVAFADESGHLIYSGSDDTLCKVWDRRCLSTGQAAGVLTGHLHGITHIDSRGDGRSFISNGKDQAIKMWDIRKMMSNADSCADGAPTWDYRYSRYPQQHKQLKHPHDQSLATYRGHSVLRTLIRCYFSPAYSTGQKYIYTGSYDSSVYIYDVVRGSQVAKLKGHQMAIRDCSWHPFEPTLVSSSWDGQVYKWTSARVD